MPLVVGIEAADGAEGVIIAELCGTEKHDVRLVKRNGGDGIRERAVQAQARRDPHHKEGFRVLRAGVQVRALGVIHNRVIVMKERFAHRHY